MNRVLAGYVRAGYIRVNRVLVRKVCGVKAEKFCQQIERTCDQHRAARAGPRHGCGMGQSLRQRRSVGGRAGGVALRVGLSMEAVIDTRGK